MLTIQTENVELDEELRRRARRGRHRPARDALRQRHGHRAWTTRRSRTSSSRSSPRSRSGSEPASASRPSTGSSSRAAGACGSTASPGRGRPSRLYLPRAESPATEESVHDAEAGGGDGTETILLAEDEESLRRLTARILEQHGYEVIAAETATEAVGSPSGTGGRSTSCSPTWSCPSSAARPSRSVCASWFPTSASSSCRATPTTS